MTGSRLSDVAQRARVSIATASRVLNDRPGVSEENRDRVHRAAAELGYARRSPQPGGHRLIGVIVPELHNPVFPAFAQELSTALSARGRTVLIGTQTEDGLSERELLRAFIDREVEGIVVVSGHHADSRVDLDPYLAARRANIPLVLINGFVEGLGATFISHDDVGGMDVAVRHLVALGHTRIGFASGPTRYTPARRKLEGFAAAMKAALGVDAPESVATSLYSVEGGAAAARELLAMGHTAIVCGSDPMAIGAIRAAGNAGLRVPRDVSVIGADDSPFMAHTHPQLTTVRQAVPEMAHAAALAVTGAPGANAPANGGAELLFEPELIVRASTGAAPVRRNTTGRKA